MVRLLNEGNSLHTALEEARKDGVVKERFFLTPAAMSALANAQKSEDHSYNSRSLAKGRKERARERKEG